MTIKNQFKTLKDNWLLLAIGAVLVFLLLGISSIGSITTLTSSNDAFYGDAVQNSMAYDTRYAPGGSESYDPSIEDRKLIKTASMSIQTETNEYNKAESQMRNIVSSNDGDITNEYVNTHGKGIGEYKSGSYTIKVSTELYESVVEELQTLGEVTSFNENTRDITESYLNTQDSLELEQEKLARYQSLYDQAESIEDKLNLEDRIANQERTVRYLEKQLANKDSRIEYTTISLSLQEEQSSFANIALLKFGDWVRNLVASLNVLLYLIAWAIPFALVIGILVFIKKRL